MESEVAAEAEDDLMTLESRVDGEGIGRGTMWGVIVLVLLLLRFD